MKPYLDILRQQFNDQIELREKRPQVYQLSLPLYHEDGDMIEIYLEETSINHFRISDFGMTIMRLSYSYDLDTENKRKIFNRIVRENHIQYENGNLFVECQTDSLYPYILQLAQTIGKISNMGQYKREVVKSLFCEMLNDFVETDLAQFNPLREILPIPERDDLEVDITFDIKPKPVFLFGVKDSSKARLSTICCLEFQKSNIPFRSFIVHEDFDSLSIKDRSIITSAADKQFVSLNDFQKHGIKALQREIA